MNRPWIVAIIFGVCLVVGIAAISWLTREVWRLDARDAEARATEERDERIRLSLWQMDAALSPIIARESARPYHAYAPLYAPVRAYNRNYAALPYPSVWIVSPLLTERPQYIVQYFQFESNGELTSPQAPVGNARDIAEGQQFVSSEAVVTATQRLSELAKVLDQKELREKLSSPTEDTVEEETVPLPKLVENMGSPEQTVGRWYDNDFSRRSQSNRMARELAQSGSSGRSQAQQMELANPQSAQSVKQMHKMQLPQQSAERFAKQKVNEQPIDLFDKWMADNMLAPQQSLGPPERIVEGLFQPFWIADRLFVARRVLVGDSELIQGFEFDWPKLRDWLIEQCVDFVPNATLAPSDNSDPLHRWHLLASLPVRLFPGEIDVSRRPTWTPARVSILVAWIGLAIAVLSVGLLLRGAVALGERRGAFVSSVTHELRTPLTSFRMYAEMLAAGMVPDEATRQKYLGTLRAEADRLSHLVENVLSYARLERGRNCGRIEKTHVLSLLERISDRFRRRAAEVGMTLHIDEPPESKDWHANLDSIAVEQILFNLTDNACKYASSAENKTIVFSLRESADKKSVNISVRDFGPGLSATSRHSPFHGFQKSAYDAARTAPGVGLGLALSRRLARRMGGDLRSVPVEGSGACFILSLPKVAG